MSNKPESNNTQHAVTQIDDGSSANANNTTATADNAGVNGYYDADFSWFGKGDTYAKRAAKLLYRPAKATISTMEWIGEQVVWGLGLDQSRFQYAVDEYDRQERKRLQKEQRALDAKAEAYRQKGLREGMDGVDEDISDIPYAPPITTASPPSTTKKLAAK